MKRVFSKTSQYVPEQFPDFYREDGPNFVEFVKKYYEWLETESPLSKSRLLFEYGDVDDTPEEELRRFVYKYMHGLPAERLGDKRFLQKHVLDLYRSKGSGEGLKLLFRMLYGEEVQYYVPSKDMLSPSSGSWVEPRYLEVTFTEENVNFYQKRVTGADSGATALVEDYVIMTRRGRPTRAFFLSNIEGEFSVGEPVTYQGLSSLRAPKIVGSASRLTLVNRVADSSLSDRYRDLGGGLVGRVSEIVDDRTGAVSFRLVFGGSGYTLDAAVTVASGLGTTEDGSPLTAEDGTYLDFIDSGQGATFRVSEITDASPVEVDATLIAPYEDDTFTDATFAYNHAILTQVGLNISTQDNFTLLTDGAGGTINDDALVSDWEGVFTVNAGTISKIAVLSAGSGYVTSVDVIVEDELVRGLGIPDGDGGTLGFNAVVEGDVNFGSDVSTSMVVIDSGFGYAQGESLVLGYAGEEYLKTEDGGSLTTEDGDVLFYGRTDSVTSSVTVELGAVGKSSGFWKNNDGMLNSEKKIQDSYYYQEYSYDVMSSRSLDEYSKILKSTFHPAGSELFGTAMVGGEALAITSTSAAINSFSYPVLSSALASSLAMGSVSVTTDQPGGLLYYVLTSNSTTPSATQIKNGLDHVGNTAFRSGFETLSSAGTKTYSEFYGTTESTAYYGHFVHQNGPAQSPTLSTGPLTTPNNLLTNTENFLSVNWKINLLNINVVENTSETVAPDGTATADTLVVVTPSAAAVQTYAMNTSTAYTLSCFYKKRSENSARWVLMYADDTVTSGAAFAWFDVQNGALGSSTQSGGWSVSSKTIHDVGNDWYRCSLSFVSGSSFSGNTRVVMYTANSNASVSRSANGTGCHAWGAQLESGNTLNVYTK